MKIKNIDHIVLTVENLEKSLNFYGNILGMEVIVFKGRKAV